jgi:hypothetical protein
LFQGHVEKFSTSRHHLGFYNNVQMTASYQNANSTIPLQDLVFHALRQVIGQHPILSAIPVDEDKTTAYFVRLPKVDLRTCAQFVERQTPVPKEGERDEELDSIIEAQHNKNFKEDYGSKPFWRLIVLSSPSSTTSFSASWVFHHAIADGTSGVVFHRSFFAALRSIAADAVTSDPVVDPPKTDLIPPLEVLHKLPLTWLYLAKAQWYDWFPKKRATLWTGGNITFDPSVAARTHLSCLNFSRETTDSLLKLSRENKTTLTATVQCLIAAATLFNLDKSKYDRLHVPGAVTCRRYLTLAPEQGHIDNAIGTWVTLYFFDHKRNSASSPSTSKEGKEETVLDLFSWDEARRLRGEIQKELSKNMKNSVINLFRWIPDFVEYYQSKVDKPRTQSFEVSNVGVFKPKEGEGEGEGWKVGRCVFSQCAPVAGSAFEVGVVTGGDGALSLGLSWPDGAVEDELIKKIVESVSEAVNGLARS